MNRGNVNSIKVGMVEDHVLFRNSLSTTLNTFDNCEVVLEASNGQEMIQKFSNSNTEIPDIILLDLNMPIMDGFETANWLKKHYPNVSILMLTMYDSELTLIRLLQAGVKGFIKKDIEIAELKFAIAALQSSGYYYSNSTTGRLANLFRGSARDLSRFQNAILDSQQLEFLKLACSDLTYKEIAQKMGLSPRSIDGIRDQLFVKLDVKSRVGLAIVAIKNGLINLYH